MEYEQRYCAFIDILGFSTLISQIAHDAASFARVRDLLRTVHEPPRSEHVRFFATSDLRAQSISDAVCISAANSVHGLAHLFATIGDLAGKLLEGGTLLRGAIVKGALYHDDKMVFGEALVRAYQLEQSVVRFPRVMVARDVAADADQFLEEDHIEVHNWVRQADDGPFFLHVLTLMELILSTDTSWERPSHVAKYNAIADQIQKRFDESVDVPRHFEKLQWFARYWNHVLTFNVKKDVRKIIGPGAASWLDNEGIES